MLVANPTKAREVGGGGELNGNHHSTATNGINSKTTTEMSLHSNGVQRNSNSLMSSRLASTSHQQSKMSSELKQTSLFEQTKSSKLGN
jgi:hypothetical protein